MKIPQRTASFTTLALFLCLVATFSLYGLGLPGDFVFDDYPNLETLGAQGGVADSATVGMYLEDSFAGPTKRPISMMSFLIDARDWPADPGALKFKNVLIHILNGLLLFVFLRLALSDSDSKRTEAEAQWVAVMASAIWLMHPLHVSTVLYIIQRMTELATLFVLAGLVGYGYGRRRVREAPAQGYALMTVAIALFTVLAGFSKENGFLLPILVLVTEYTLYSRAPTQLNRVWKWVVLWAPAIVLMGAIYYMSPALEARLAFREFSVLERLLTEPRVIFDYLFHLFVPFSQTKGLFQSYELSRSLTSPMTTLYSLVGVVALIAVGLAARKRLPLLAFGILFYLAGHLVESTSIPLELYFEHRNYLPSLMLFVPIAWVVVRVAKADVRIGWAVALAILGVLAITLGARSDLWGNRDALYLLWAQENPYSARAQLAATNVVYRMDGQDAALAFLLEAMERKPDSLKLNLHYVRLMGREGRVLDPGVRERIEVGLGSQPVKSEVLAGLRKVTDDVLTGKTEGISRRTTLSWWRALEGNPRVADVSTIQSLISHYLGLHAASAGDIEGAVRHFNKSLSLGKQPGTGILQAAVLASHGGYCQALVFLDKAESLLANAGGTSSKRDYYASEIGRLRKLIGEDAENENLTCH